MLRNVDYDMKFTASWLVVVFAGAILFLFTGGVYKHILHEGFPSIVEMPGIYVALVIQYLFVLYSYRLISRRIQINENALYVRNIINEFHIEWKEIRDLNIVYAEKYTTNMTRDGYDSYYEIHTDLKKRKVKISRDPSFEELLTSYTGIEWQEHVVSME